jgi:signal transduction histidine kinase
MIMMAVLMGPGRDEVLPNRDPVEAEAAVAAEIPRFEAKNIALDLVGVPQGACVLGDSFRLEQVMANLLDNALRHTPPGGRVSVTLIKRKSSFHIHVADTGEGIPKDQLHAIFERFHRVDSSRVTKDGGGSGLGLTIAKAIINNHGGNLEAMSEGRGRGSTFVLGLPAAPRR